MPNRRFHLISLVAGLVLSGAIAFSGSSPVSAATSLTASCPSADTSLTVASGEVITVAVGTCTSNTIVYWGAPSAVTGTPTAGFGPTGGTAISTSATTFTISFTNSTPGRGATIRLCEDANTNLNCDSGEDKHEWVIMVTPAGSSSGSSGSSGCEVAGKPCAVRPWPWPIAYTDYINISWEALIPAEAGTGGVTAYRVESTPAGGTCLLRTIDLADGEELPTNCNITGLEPNTDYTFTVYASSAYGQGPGRSTQEPIRLLSATTPAVTVPAVTPETPAPTLPATGNNTTLPATALLLASLGGLSLLLRRRYN